MTSYHVVVWGEFWRVLNERNQIVAVCETREEADAYIAGQDGG